MTGIFWGASGLTGNLAMLCLLGYGKLWLSDILQQIADLQVERWYRVARYRLGT